jgi:hypothetical protein
VPSSIGAGAVYGVGVYGTSQYGVASVTVLVDGVTATATLNSTLQISADAKHAVCGLCIGAIDGFIGSNASFIKVNVTGDAVVIPTGVEVTFDLGNVSQRTNNTIPVVSVVGNVETGVLSLESNNYIDVLGFGIATAIGNVLVAAKATVDITGVFGTPSIGTVTILENEVITSSTNIAVLTAGNITITTTSFNFNSVASQYSRNRTAYIPRRPSSKERTVIVPAGQ